LGEVQKWRQKATMETGRMRTKSAEHWESDLKNEGQNVENWEWTRKLETEIWRQAERL
jgi:hypothetical protein